MLDRHQELRSMALAFAVEVWPDSIPTCINMAKELQSALDAECEAAGHNYKFTPEMVHYHPLRIVMPEYWGPCQDCGKVKPE